MVSFLKYQETSIPHDSVAGSTDGQFSEYQVTSIPRD